MMSRYYATAKGVDRLLRPPTAQEEESIDRHACGAQARGGRARAVLGVGRPLRWPAGRRRHPRLRARSHEWEAPRRSSCWATMTPSRRDGRDDGEGAGALADALDSALKAMNGSGIFRSPREHGVGAHAYRNEVRAANRAIEQWRREAYAVLRRHLLPDSACCRKGTGGRQLRAAGAFARRSARGAAVPVESVSPGCPLGDDPSRPRGLGPRLPRCQRLDGRGNAAHRRAARRGSRRTSAGRSGRSATSWRRPASSRGASSPTPRAAPASAACSSTWRAPGRAPPSSSPTDTSSRSRRRRWLPPAARACTRSSRRDGNTALLQRAGLPYTQLSRLPS